MEFNIKDYLTLAEYSKKINIDRAAVYRRIVANRMPAIKIGSAWFVHKDTEYNQPLDAQYDNSKEVPYMLLSDYAKAQNFSSSHTSRLFLNNQIEGAVKIGGFVLVPNNAKILPAEEVKEVENVNVNNYTTPYKVAREYNLNVEYIRSLVRTNKIPGTIKHKGKWLIPKSTNIQDIIK
ncbi:MAG: helix-turn-helix domain-containing protein [Christensenellaceae bacterium]|nr:helix-turn-helix domain-containing protein [Christensenellaceae bacterium]